MNLKHLYKRFQRNRKPSIGIFDPYKSIAALSKDNDDFYDNEEWQYSQPKSTFAKSPIIITRVFIALVLVLFGWRLLSLQIEQGSANYSLAEGNRLRVRHILSSRGLIFDRNGQSLVKNVPTFSLVIYSSEIPKKATDKDSYIKDLSAIVQVSEQDLRSKIDAMSKKQQSFSLVEGLDREKALVLELRTEKFPGVVIEKAPSRTYTTQSGLSHIIGYVGKVSEDDLNSDPALLSLGLIGKAGIEKVYDKDLRGTPGLETVEVDSKGRSVRQVSVEPAETGKSIYLSIDKGLQEVAATAIQETLVKAQAKNGVAIATDVTTGEILAMVSLPDYDNNTFLPQGDQAKRQAILIDTTAPLLNRAIAGQYPSGSTIKPAVAAIALQEGVINEGTKLDTSEGKITIGEWSYPDWKTHGITDVKKAIAESNNIFFYSLGGGYKNIKGLGADKLGEGFKKFGFGQMSGIDLPGEQDGIVPTPDWKKRVKKESWYIGDTYHMAIGQGDIEVTPLQLNLSTVTIANGGKLLRPHLLKTVSSDKGTTDINVNDMIRSQGFISEGNLKIVRDGMREAVISGSARAFNNLPVQVAAKTGTAQFDNVSKDKTHSWFTSFAPYDNPKIAVTVIIEGGGEGYLIAAPVARSIIEKYFNLPITPIAVPTPEPTN